MPVIELASSHHPWDEKWKDQGQGPADIGQYAIASPIAILPLVSPMHVLGLIPGFLSRLFLVRILLSDNVVRQLGEDTESNDGETNSNNNKRQEYSALIALTWPGNLRDVGNRGNLIQVLEVV